MAKQTLCFGRVPSGMVLLAVFFSGLSGSMGAKSRQENGGEKAKAANIEEWQRVRVLGYGRIVRSEYSPDGQRLATNAEGGLLEIRAADSGQIQLQLDLQTPRPAALAWSPDGSTIALSYLAPRVIDLLDSHTGERLWRAELDDFVAGWLAWSPDGWRLASGENTTRSPHRITIRETKKGELLTAFSVPGSSVQGAVGWSPDGRFLAAGAGVGLDAVITLWDGKSYRILRTLRAAGALSFSWSPDSTKLVSAFGTRGKIWEVSSGKLLGDYIEHHQSIKVVRWSPDGRRIASGSLDQSVKIWAVETGTLERTLVEGPDQPRIFSLSWSNDSRRLAVPGAAMVNIWSVETGKILRSFSGHTGWVSAVRWSPDGCRIASASWDQTIRIWNPETGETVNILRGHTQRVLALSWSPDGRWLASGSWDQTVRIWDAQRGELLTTLTDHRGAVDAVAWSPNSKWLASSSGTENVILWEAEDWRILATFPVSAFSVAWSPESNRLLCGGMTTGIWSIETGQQEIELLGHMMAVTSVSWSPDGQRVATGAGDGTVKIWDAERGETLHTLSGSVLEVWSVDWAPDSRLLASGDRERSVRIWDAETGEGLQTLLGHMEPPFVVSVAFSPDGRRLASGAWDQTIRIWARSGEKDDTSRELAKENRR